MAAIENNRDFTLSLKSHEEYLIPIRTYHSAHFQAYNRKRSSFLNSFRAPPGARTLDPNIKSVVLYQLS